MNRSIRLVLLGASVSLALMPLPRLAAQDDASSFDYFQHTRQLVERGTQALILCNGLFLSQRSVEQIYAQELSFRRIPLLHLADGVVRIDRQAKTVVIGGGPGTGDPLPKMRAAYREGLGSVVLSPAQTFDDLDALPELKLPPLTNNPAEIAWPDGDLLPAEALPTSIDLTALDAATDWAFDVETPTASGQITASVLVVHRGQIVFERYAPGFDATTRTRIYSVSKSLAVTLFGMLVDRGELALDASLEFDWLPASSDADSDPRQAITLRDLLQMSSGLQSVDNENAFVSGSRQSYWAGASSVRGALSRGLVRAPGTHWDYENFDTLLAVLAMKRALGGGAAYLEFPRRALLDKIGMRSTVIGADRLGDFMLSSQVYTTARDLARLGLLYLNGGRWNEEQLVSREWIEFCWSAAPSTASRGGFYGAQWWRSEVEGSDSKREVFSARGNRGNYLAIVPSLELIVVRRGLDRSAPGDRAFDMDDLVQRVAAAVSEGG